MLGSVVNLLGSVAAVMAIRGQGDTAELVRLVAVLVGKGSQSSAELDALADKIEVMVAEGRGPTEEEIAAVRERRKTLITEIENIVIEDN